MSDNDVNLKINPEILKSIQGINVSPVSSIYEESMRSNRELLQSIESTKREKDAEDLRRHNELVDALRSAGENGATIVIGDNNNALQIMQNTESSVQEMENSQSFNYDNAMSVLKDIKEYMTMPKFNEAFGENSETIKNLVETTLLAVEQKEEPSVIKKSFGIIKDLAVGVTGSIIASGIVGLITVAGIL